MTPYKNTKFLHALKDYENYEFRSAINVWDVQPQFKKDIEKIKFMEFDVHPGFVLYIPPYWWYSIKLVGDNTLATTITYKTIMNYMATLPDLARYYIQQTNIQKKVARTMDLEKTVETEPLVEETISDTI
jgi:ribosomal protein L16 Arg81 hydroxylase